MNAASFDGFLNGRTDLQAGRIRKALGKRLRFQDIGVATIQECIEQRAAAGTLKIDTDQEPAIKPMSRAQFFRADNEQQRAHERRMKEAGTRTVYYVNNSPLGKTAYDYAAYLLQGGQP